MLPLVWPQKLEFLAYKKLIIFCISFFNNELVLSMTSKKNFFRIILFKNIRQNLEKILNPSFLRVDIPKAILLYVLNLPRLNWQRFVISNEAILNFIYSFKELYFQLI